MSETTLKRAIYFLAVVTGLYLLTALLGGGGGGNVASSSALADILSSANEESATWVEIVGPTESIRLEQGAQGWTVNGYVVDSTAVARFWRGLQQTEVASIAATNPTNHERLGVTSDAAWSLILGDEDTRILLGNSGSQFQTAYARLPDQDAVHMIRGDLQAATKRPLSDWRDKVALRLDTTRVATVRVQRGGESLVFERGDSAWSVNGVPADEQMVRGILQELASFTATGFAPDSSVMNATPDRSVTVLDASGAEVASVALDEGDGNLRAKSSQSPYLFEVPSWRADRIAPTREDEEGG